jgi:CAAX protease family protein
VVHGGRMVRSAPVGPLLKRLLWDQWQAIQDEHTDEARRHKNGSRPLDWRPLVVLFVTAVSLTLLEYCGQRSSKPHTLVSFAQLVPKPRNANESYWELWSFAWWTGWRVFCYFVLPATVIALIPGERLRNYGFAVRGLFKHLWIYVALLALVLPLVVAMSYTKSFQDKYPFYSLADRSTFDLVVWEVLYAVQFLALEFFFRGFMLHGLKHAIGAHAIWVMIVPYCMIHYGKPMAETLGAIFAGLILGTLALRTRSIWLGVFIHVSVALTMDLLSLAHQRVP